MTLQSELQAGAMRMLSAQLRNAPAAQDVPYWVDTTRLVLERYGLTDDDAERVQAAIMRHMTSRDVWPTPSELLASLPPKSATVPPERRLEKQRVKREDCASDEEWVKRSTADWPEDLRAACKPEFLRQDETLMRHREALAEALRNMRREVAGLLRSDRKRRRELSQGLGKERGKR